MATISIEEKAKAYEEAIEKAKSLYKAAEPMSGCKVLMEAIFPELKESEDEQHRKWILEYLYDGLRKSDEQFKGQFKAAIAWLEKQGNLMKALQISNSRIAELVEEKYNLEEKLKKQSEQKVSYTTLVETGNGGINALVTRELPTDSCDNEQKSAWSEEDENRMDNLCHFLEECVNQYYGHLTLQDTINWLKSLKERYTWLPSDEQMAALSDMNCTGCISYAVQGQELINLYNDLKKLK